MPEVCVECGDFRIGPETVCETCGNDAWIDLADAREYLQEAATPDARSSRENVGTESGARRTKRAIGWVLAGAVVAAAMYLVYAMFGWQGIWVVLAIILEFVSWE